MMIPTWLRELAAWSLVLSALCAVLVVIDLIWRPQRMKIMNVVWPVTALWAGPLGLFTYILWGRAVGAAQAGREKPPGPQQPFAVLTAKAATHCGSGCTLGDIFAESLIVVAPLTLFGKHIFGAWLYDFVLAYAFGVVFQYFTIKPMQELSRTQSLIAALKADTASLVAWQLGMYGWMALATFVLFRHELPKGTATFWFMMQIAMLCGFLMAYPVNWLLLRRGVKAAM